MKIKEIQEILLCEIGKKIFGYGFIRKNKSQSFIKAFQGGKSSFHLSFRDFTHENQFDVSCDVAIRFNAVEDLVNTMLMGLTNKEKKDTYSIGVQLGNWALGEWKAWNIAKVDDVNNVSDEIMAFFGKAGILYIEKYSDPESAFRAIIDDDRRSQQHSPFHDTRAKKAIALAYVLKKYDLIETLIDKKIVFLNVKDKKGLDSFLKFADYIKKLLQGRIVQDRGHPESADQNRRGIGGESPLQGKE